MGDNVDIKTRLKNMNRKEKIGYIWEYYRFHIIGSIVVISIIVSLVSSMVNKKNYVLAVNVLGNISSQKVDKLQNNIKKNILKDSNSKDAVTIQSMTHSSDIQLEAAMIQKLAAMVATGDLDVMITTKQDFKKYAKQAMFKKLDNKIINQLNISQTNLLKAKAKGDKKSQFYGIKISNLSGLKEIGYDSKDKIVSIIVTAKNKRNAVKFVKWLIK